MKLYVRSRHVILLYHTPQNRNPICGANVRLGAAQNYFNDDALMLEEHCTGPCADQVSKLSAEVFGPPTGALGEGTFAAASQAPPWIHPGGPTVPGAQPLRDGADGREAVTGGEPPIWREYEGTWECTWISGDQDSFLASQGVPWFTRIGFQALGSGVGTGMTIRLVGDGSAWVVHFWLPGLPDYGESFTGAFATAYVFLLGFDGRLRKSDLPMIGRHSTVGAYERSGPMYAVRLDNGGYLTTRHELVDGGTGIIAHGAWIADGHPLTATTSFFRRVGAARNGSTPASSARGWDAAAGSAAATAANAHPLLVAAAAVGTLALGALCLGRRRPSSTARAATRGQRRLV